MYSKLMKRNLITSLLLTFLSLALLFLIINFVIYHSVRGEIENRNQLMAKTLGKHTDSVLLNVINDMTIISEYSKRLYDNEDQILMDRSEEHTSELQSRGHLVCRLLLEKKNCTTL